jgi:amino acid adenylation domain-containing protein
MIGKLADALIPPSVDSPGAETIPARFAAVVARFPNRTAVREKDLVWTYRELDELSNRYATAVRMTGCEAGATVAVTLTSLSESLAVMLGVLKAGKTFLFLDPAMPEARLHDVCRTFHVAVLIAEPDKMPWSGFPGSWLDNQVARATPARDQAGSAPTSGFDPCLLVQTSGTTGQPLGVVINHRTLLDTIQNYSTFAEITPKDRFTLLTAPSFLSAHTASFGAFLNGATLLPFDVKSHGLRAMARWLQEEAPTLYQSTPTLFRALTKNLSASDRFPQLRFLRLGGEPVLASDYALFRSHFDARAVFANTLGMSEAGGNIAYFLIKGDFQPGSHVLPIGFPSRGREVVLMDKTGQPVPAGELGEIVVRSEFLASGYYGNEELTAKRFRSSTRGRELWTGDLGRLTPEGWLEHCGRKDDQTKMRGHRVDLTELESILRSLEGVESAVALVRENGEAPQELVAFLVLQPNSRRTVLALRNELVGRVPSHLIPHAIAIVEQLPLTAGGKIDRKKLLQTKTGDHSGSDAVHPRTPMETQVARVWGDILAGEPVGLYDNFFASGGDSLKGMNLLARLSNEFGFEFAPSDLLKRPTVAQMAEYISARRSKKGLARWKVVLGKDRSEGMVPLHSKGSRPPLFIFPGGAASETELLVFASMLPLLPPDLPVYGLKQNFALRACYPARSVEIIARNYLREMVGVQPEGPYHLLAECVASIVVLEVARQLEVAGQSVSRMILLNPHRPRVRAKSENISSKLRRYYRILREAPLASFDGPVQVISFRDEDQLTRTLGQNPFAPGRMEWIEVPGNHLTFTRQHGANVARHIARILG